MMFCGTAFCGAIHSVDSTPTKLGDIISLTLDNAIYDSIFATGVVALDWNGQVRYDWDYHTYLYAAFQNDLYGGNCDFTIDNVDMLKIKRRKKGEHVYKTLYEVPIKSNEDFTFQRYDYLAAANQKYEYAIVPCFGGVEGTTRSNSVLSEFEGVFLVERDVAYQALLNMELTHKRVKSGSSVTTLGRRMPFHVSNGASNYTAGSLSATYIPHKDGQYDVDNGWKYREDINDFLTNGKPKILKNFEGKIWIIYILEDTIDETQKDHYQNVVTSFDWNEAGDANNTADLYYNGFIDGDPSEFGNDSTGTNENTGTSSGGSSSSGSGSGGSSGSSEQTISTLAAQIQYLQNQITYMKQNMASGITVDDDNTISITSEQGVVASAKVNDGVTWEEDL